MPSSMDVTCKHLPSPLKSANCVSATSKSGQKKTLSPLRKRSEKTLSDLQRNGGLTVACVKHTETGTQTVAMNPSKLEDAMGSKNGTVVVERNIAVVSLEDYAMITPEERPSVFSTPAKNYHDATPKSMLPHDVKSPAKVEEGKHETKDNNAVTPSSTSTITLDSVSTPGSSKTCSPIRLKRSVVDKNEPEKRDGPRAKKAMAKKLSAKDAKAAVMAVATAKTPRGVKPKAKKLSAKDKVAGLTVAPTKTPRGVKPKAKKLSAKDKVAGLTVAPTKTPRGVKPIIKKFTGKDKPAAPAKTSRGRSKTQKLQLQKHGNRFVGYEGQFSGGETSNDAFENKGKEYTIDEKTVFAWNRSTVQDLLDYGHGYRIECLPKCPEGSNAIAETAQAALKHLKDEVAKKRDLKDSDSYYICGRRFDQDGIQYEVVWSKYEEELGMEFGENYLYFEEYDHVEYFRDKMPPGLAINGNFETGDMETHLAKCKDGGGNGRKIEGKASRKDGCLNGVGIGPIVKRKREPSDSEIGNENKSAKLITAADSDHSKIYVAPVTNDIQMSNFKKRNPEPIFIDLTYSP